MNNAITEIKNTLEGTNSRIIEAEDRISEVEDRIVDTNDADREKKNEVKLRDLLDNIKHSNIWIIGIPEEEDKKKGHEKILEEIIAENFPKIGEGNSHPSPRNPESPKQDKPKAKHPKTHINQIDEDHTQRTNIKSSNGKTTNNTQGDSHKDNSWSINRNPSGQKGIAGNT